MGIVCKTMGWPSHIRQVTSGEVDHASEIDRKSVRGGVDRCVCPCPGNLPPDEGGRGISRHGGGAKRAVRRHPDVCQRAEPGRRTRRHGVQCSWHVDRNIHVSRQSSQRRQPGQDPDRDLAGREFLRSDRRPDHERERAVGRRQGLLGRDPGLRGLGRLQRQLGGCRHAVQRQHRSDLGTRCSSPTQHRRLHNTPGCRRRYR